MIQPSIHKRDIGIEPHGCERGVVRHARFSPMLAHVHDAAMEVGEGPETQALGGGAHAVGRLRLIVQAATFPSPRSALLRITDSTWTSGQVRKVPEAYVTH
jgi:hypothetical protein